MTKTYSFQEAELMIDVPDYLRITTNGLGVGSISINYEEARTGISVSADGVPVVSKLADKHGSVSLTIQQTSDCHKKLLKAFNWLDSSENISKWASIQGIFINRSTGEQIQLLDMAFNGIPDRSYQASAGTLEWTFTVSEINSNIIE